MSSRNEKLIKNVVLFAIGNIGSKLLQIILVPIYTRVMSSAEYGTVDVMQAIVSLLIPIFSFSIFEAVFRYAMEKNYDKNAVYSVGVLISCIGGAILVVCGIAASNFVEPIFVLLVISNTFFGFVRSMLSQYSKAVEKTVLYTIDSVLITVCVLILNIIFIIQFKWGVNGYMLGYILANFISCIFLYIFLGNYRKLSIKNVTKSLVKEMLLFSLPLIPNGVCWWISSFIDRMIVTGFIGEAANGIYAAGHKIPSLLTVVVTIFFQAWQMSANQEFKKNDISDFYTEIHNQIFSTITLISSTLILFCKPITSIFLGDEYFSAWQVMPFLLVSTGFFSFAQFLGSIYTANKKTGMALVTNLLGVAVSLTVNLILVGAFKIGIVGSAIASVCTYLILWCSRIATTNKIVFIKYQKNKVIPAVTILILQAAIVTFSQNDFLSYFASTISLIVLIIIFSKDVINLLKFGYGFVAGFLKKNKN